MCLPTPACRVLTSRLTAMLHWNKRAKPTLHAAVHERCAQYRCFDYTLLSALYRSHAQCANRRLWRPSSLELGRAFGYRWNAASPYRRGLDEAKLTAVSKSALPGTAVRVDADACPKHIARIAGTFKTSSGLRAPDGGHRGHERTFVIGDPPRAVLSIQNPPSWPHVCTPRGGWLKRLPRAGPQRHLLPDRTGAALHL